MAPSDDMNSAFGLILDSPIPNNLHFLVGRFWWVLWKGQDEGKLTH